MMVRFMIFLYVILIIKNVLLNVIRNLLLAVYFITIWLTDVGYIDVLSIQCTEVGKGF